MKNLHYAGGALLCLVLAAHIGGNAEPETWNAKHENPAPRGARGDFDWDAVFRVRDYLRGYPAFMPEGQAMKIAYAIHVASLNHGISHEMILSVIATESSFETAAVSPKGAVGLMQIMPATGQFLTAELALPWAGAETLRDPRVNIECGTYYLKSLHRQFGNWETALLAYNYGPTVIAERLAFEEGFSPSAFQYPKSVLGRNWPSLASPDEAALTRDVY